MGLRSRLKKIVREFSGEYSSAAPEQTTPYDRPGVPNDGADVVMARLNRPGANKGTKSGPDDGK